MTLAGLTLASLAAAASAQTVTVMLSSPQNGQNVSAGATINWTIGFTASGGDNEGLALLVADLVQDEGNPATLDIPPAGSVPGAMANFARPAGITNPAGYSGTQVGAAGARNLLQIGGGQNTFGVAPPSGSGLGQSVNVVSGVGQSGAVTLASGSFTAPGTPGEYTFRLANVRANTLVDRNNAPAFSPVSDALVDATAGTITFSVGGSSCVGDLDGDNDVDLSDLAVMLANYGTTSGAGPEDGDTDSDGDVDLTDLAVLLSAYGTPC